MVSNYSSKRHDGSSNYLTKQLYSKLESIGNIVLKYIQSAVSNAKSMENAYM